MKTSNREELLKYDWKHDLQKNRDQESTVNFLLQYQETKKQNKNIKSKKIKFRGNEIEVFYCKKRFDVPTNETCGDTEMKLVIYNLIQPWFKVIEGGTYVGMYTLRMASILNEKQGGKIYGFEANKLVATLLNESVYANNFQNKVELHNFALYNQSKLMSIYGFKRSYASTLTHIAAKRKNITKVTFNTDKQKNPAEFEVFAVSLDDFFPEEVLPEVNFMKLDLEHSEIPALFGAQKLISRSKNVVIIIEMMGIVYQIFTQKTIDDCFN